MTALARRFRFFFFSILFFLCFFFFFSSRRRHTRWPRDWSSDVCSSDLDPAVLLVDNIEDADVGKESGIMRLSTRRRIERRPIEHECGVALVRDGIEKRRVEFAQVSVGVVETFSHLGTTWFEARGPRRLLHGSPARAIGSCRSGRRRGRPAAGRSNYG